MNKKIEAVLKEQEELNYSNKFSMISRETGKLLNLLVRIKEPKRVLEIGTSIGYSGIWLASALNKNSKLITLERWPERAEIAKKFFKKAKLPIKLIEGDALEIIPGLKQRFDLVFIDATKAEYLKYLQVLIKNKKLNKNALIIADNTASHAEKMKDFLNYVKEKGITIEVGKGITLFSC